MVYSIFISIKKNFPHSSAENSMMIKKALMDNSMSEVHIK